jgi:hypothetical protein
MITFYRENYIAIGALQQGRGVHNFWQLGMETIFDIQVESLTRRAHPKEVIH